MSRLLSTMQEMDADLDVIGGSLKLERAVVAQNLATASQQPSKVTETREGSAPVASNSEEQHIGQKAAATGTRFVAEGREFEWKWSEARATWQLFDVETQTLVHQAPPAAESVGDAGHDEL